MSNQRWLALSDRQTQLAADHPVAITLSLSVTIALSLSFMSLEGGEEEGAQGGEGEEEKGGKAEGGESEQKWWTEKDGEVRERERHAMKGK